MGPISSSNRNGSNSEKEALGNGRRTRKPPPSRVSILLTMPDTVRPALLTFSLSLNTSITCMFLLPSSGYLLGRFSRVIFYFPFRFTRRSVADFLQQAHERFA